MNEQYKYFGESLKTKMAKELILELFAGKTPSKKEIVKRVDEVHLERGGRRAETKAHPVTSALVQLKENGRANNPNQGFWQIDKEVFIGEEDGVRWMGSGDSSVYLYYYPTYKKYAEIQGEETWPCKIGSTEYSDPIHRIYEQIGTGMPEQPEVALVMRTNRQKEMETAIHKLLNRLPDAPGKEWFMTNPSKVEAIYNILIKDYS